MIQKGSRLFDDFCRTDLSCPRLLGWSQTQLAKAAERSLPTIKRLERNDGEAPLCPTMLETLFSGPWRKRALSSSRRMAAVPASE